MTTGSDFPPHESRGPLAQVGDAGGGLVPALTPAPVPNAIAGGSPGLSAAAAKPPPTVPTLPSDDPASVALLIARMANEMFGGQSVVPVPSPQQLVSGVGVSPPGSPGIAPSLAPGPLPLSGVPTEPSTAAVPQAGAIAPSLAPVPSGTPFSASPSFASPAAFGGGAPAGASSAMPVAASPAQGAAGAIPVAGLAAPSVAYGTGLAASSATPASSGAAPHAATASHARADGAPAIASGVGGNPFATPPAFSDLLARPTFDATYVPVVDAAVPSPQLTGMPTEPTSPAVPSLAPMPSAQQVSSATGMSPPGSPGIAPALAAAPLPVSGVPTEPSTAAHAGTAIAPSAPVPSATPFSAAPAAPTYGSIPGASAPAGVGTTPMVGTPGLAASGSPARTPGATTSSNTITPTGGTPASSGAAPYGATASHARPDAAPASATGVGPATWGGGNPFAMPLSLPDDFAMPAFDATYLPLVELTGVDAQPAWVPQQVQPAPVIDVPTETPVIRDLGGAAFDPYRVRADFPILEERVHGKRLVWLDNAATTQKPLAVIERLRNFYTHENSNIHRAAHTLAARATDAYEQARETSRKFLNAPSANEIIFVRGATEGINLVAQSWGRRNISAGDEIVITHLEHHANIVPWQQLCAEKGARLRVAPVDDRGDVILEEYEKLFNPRTRLAAIPQVSNALGTITPAREMVEIAHRYGAKVLLDGAQAVSHMRVDVQLLDCDFYVFSGHKVFAPTGIGVVFGKRELLEQMPPWQGGGNMIQDVTFEKTTYMPPPFRFEAGTGSIGDAAGLGAALEYVMKIGMDVIDRYEHDLLVYATEHLLHVPGLTMIGTSPNKAGVLSFILDGQRTEDVGAWLDKEGIAVRSGHHCAQPILRRFGLEASVRASLAFYNICEDIDALVEALHRLQSGRR